MRAAAWPISSPSFSRRSALTFVRQSAPRDTQEHVFKLLGLIWGGAPQPEVQCAAAFAVVRGQSDRQALDLSAPVSFFIADGAGRVGYQAGDRDLAKRALEDWQRTSGVPLRFTQAPEAAALIRVYWAMARFSGLSSMDAGRLQTLYSNR